MESVLNFVVLVTIGALFIWYDTRLFALYSFAVVIGLIIHFTGRVWKLIHIARFSNAAKLMLIAKKLRVADTEYDQLIAEMRQKDPRWWASLERNLKDL